MENVNSAQISEGFASAETAEETAPGYKPLNLGAAVGTRAKSGGDGDFTDATHQNN